MIVRRAKSLREKKELGREITLHRTPRRGRLAPKLVPILEKKRDVVQFQCWAKCNTVIV